MPSSVSRSSIAEEHKIPKLSASGETSVPKYDHLPDAMEVVELDVPAATYRKEVFVVVTKQSRGRKGSEAALPTASGRTPT